MRRGGKGPLGNDAPARLVRQHAPHGVAAEVAARRCHRHVELDGLRLIVEEQPAVVGIQQKDIDRRRQDLDQTDVIEPRRSGRPAVILEQHRRRPVGLDHDRPDLI